MSQFLVQGKHLSTNYVWFENADDFVVSGGYDRLVLHANPSEIEYIGKYKCKVSPQDTLISDLSQSEEELWSATAKSVRNEINRGKREEVQIQIFRADEITEHLLNGFAKMYQEMYQEKGMPHQFLNITDLKIYAENDALVVTTASINENIVVYHSYIKDDIHSRSLHSCSEFRVQDNATRRAIGRANKYLHWSDLLCLKEMGVQEYDWGGISSYDNPNGIDEFKMSFGGVHRRYYNLSCACSPLAKFYELYKKIFHNNA